MLYSISRLSELTGFARDTIAGRLKEAGVEEHETSTSNLKLFDTQVVLPILYGAPASGQAELSRERARLARAQAVKTERENEVRNRFLLRAEEVERHVTGAFLALVQSLATLPDRLETSATLTPEAASMLHAAIDAAREVLYQDLVAWIDQQPKPGDADARGFESVGLAQSFARGTHGCGALRGNGAFADAKAGG